MSRTAAKARPESESSKPGRAAHPQATRETVESIVIAVILAFLFRGFIAEAFVIPTGSMAPTLQGRHIDVRCPECGIDYRTGASEENERRGMVEETFCPNCRFPLELDRRRNPNQASFNGDRILVSKFAYELAEPSRWDVIVFKYPGNAKQNYIKRLIGLPGELVRIRHGDIFTARRLFELKKGDWEGVEEGELPAAWRRGFAAAGLALSEKTTVARVARQDYPLTVPDQAIGSAWWVVDPDWREDARREVNGRFFVRQTRGEAGAQVYSDFAIARKPPDKQLALLQTVYDTRYPGRTLRKLGWPSRWGDASATPVWQESPQGEYAARNGSAEWSWLRYRHIAPSEHEWRAMVDADRLPDKLDRAEGELISDYYTYNDRYTSAVEYGRLPGRHWVGDVALECEVTVESDAGELALDLVEGGVHYRCTFDLSSGTARLSKSDGQPFSSAEGRETGDPTAATKVRGPGTYRLQFANVDDQLRLWVNGKLVAFAGATTYASSPDVAPRWSADDPGDLAPAGVGVNQASVRVAWLRVARDVYYLAIASSGMTDYALAWNDGSIQDLFRNPREWESSTLFASRRTAEFVVREDRFLPLGDNSPQSQDGRLWGDEPAFERKLLIGKAMLIYWPHAWRRPIPFFPNFGRMGLIR